MNSNFTKKTTRIINFKPSNFHTSPLFKQNSILKFQDKICLENILFATKYLSNLSPSIFNIWFSFSLDQHNYETSSSTHNFMDVNSYVGNKVDLISDMSWKLRYHH